MSDTGPREEDGDYAREFFDAYERQADEATPEHRRGCTHVEFAWPRDYGEWWR